MYGQTTRTARRIGPIWRWLTGIALALTSASPLALTIEFDYRFDDGYFADAQRRARLEQAASFYSGFSDSLTPIAPEQGNGQGNSWEVGFFHPSQLGYGYARVTDLFVPADTLVVFVGASSMGSGVLGFATTGDILALEGNTEFTDAVTTRGQSPLDDYGVWGGALIFNSDVPWYFDEDGSGLTRDSHDFLTTAAHELGHVLGYGGAMTWSGNLQDGLFYGANAVAVYGAPVPASEAHWGRGVASDVDGATQGTLMDPSTPRGVRELPTRLDYAGFADIGWNVQPVPLPSAMMLWTSGLLLLGSLARGGGRCR